MSTINVSITDQQMSFTNMPLISSGDINIDEIQFSFDTTWSGYSSKVCTFYRNGEKGAYYFATINGSGKATIPSGVMREKGRIYFGVSGKNGNSIKTTEVLSYFISEGAYTEAADSDHETFAEIKSQMLAIKSEIDESAIEIVNVVNNAKNELSEEFNEQITDIKNDVESIDPDVTRIKGFLGLGDTVTYTLTSNDSNDKFYGLILANGTLRTGGVQYFVMNPIPVVKGSTVDYKLVSYGDQCVLAFSENNLTADYSALTPLVIGNGELLYKRGSVEIEQNGYLYVSYKKESLNSYELSISAPNDTGGFLDLIDGNAIHRPIRTSACKFFGDQPKADGSTNSFCNTATGNYTDLINTIYEQIRTAYPTIVSRENVGKDASGTYDMYIYTFEPEYYQQHVLLTAGVHPEEYFGVACLARIMQMIYGETEDEDLLYMRQNVKFTVIPVVNVWGFNQSPKVRRNSANQDMQSWNQSNPPTEIALYKAKIANIANQLSFAMDFHSGNGEAYKKFYGVINRNDKNVRTLFKTTGWLCEKYSRTTSNPNGDKVSAQKLGTLTNYPGVLSNVLFSQYKVPSSTMELCLYWWNNGDYGRPTSTTMGVTMWLNYLIQQVNDGYKILSDIPSTDYKATLA